jgi:phenylalanyl-tRNA synthetase beta chain
VALFGIGIENLFDASNEEKIYRQISKFPSVRRDISMFVPEQVKYADIEKEVAKTGGSLVKNVELFDRYQNSIALRLEIGSREKTLTSVEIDGVVKKIVAKLEKDLKVKVRK